MISCASFCNGILNRKKSRGHPERTQLPFQVRTWHIAHTVSMGMMVPLQNVGCLARFMSGHYYSGTL